MDRGYRFTSIACNSAHTRHFLHILGANILSHIVFVKRLVLETKGPGTNALLSPEIRGSQSAQQLRIPGVASTTSQIFQIWDLSLWSQHKFFTYLEFLVDPSTFVWRLATQIRSQWHVTRDSRIGSNTLGNLYRSPPLLSDGLLTRMGLFDTSLKKPRLPI